MSQSIDKLNFSNCFLGDNNFAALLQGARKLDHIYSITYQNDELRSKATKELIGLLNAPLDIMDKLG
jgi:hypothetical protein